MAEKTQYVIELNDRLSPGLKKAAASAMGLDNAMKGINGTTKQSGGAFSSLGGAIKKLAGPLALAAAAMKGFQFASESVKTAREFEGLENAITFASGSAEAGAQNMDFLRQRSEMLGTDLRASAEGFKTLSSSMIGSSLEGQATRDIFDGVQVAASVMGLSADDAKGTFLALGQIMGKGKVQAEELRGQIGERIPGAFNIAAKAMGVSTSELNKMMEQGQLIAEDFLPKFSDELKRTFGPGLEKSVNSSQAQFNRFNNSMLELKLNVGKFLMPAVNEAMRIFKEVFDFLKRNSTQIKEAFSPLIDTFITLKNVYIDFYKELFSGAQAADVAQESFSAFGRALNFLKPSLDGLIKLLKAPYDLIIDIKDALSGLFDAFPVILRGLVGVAMAVRETFTVMLEGASRVFSGLGKIIKGAFSGNAKLMAEGVLESQNILRADKAVNAGGRIADAFKEGLNKEFSEGVKLDFGGGKKTENFTSLLDPGAGGAGTGSAAAAAAAGGKKSSTSLEGVKSGRPTNINISIGKLIEAFNVTATNLEDINNKSKDLVAQALLSAVNNVNNIAR